MVDAPKFTRIQIPLDYSPAHAAAIGRLLGHWAILEDTLITMLQVLLNIDPFRAEFIYKEFVSTRSKIVLLRRLNNFFTADPNIKTQIDNKLKQAKELNETRNKFVHAIWGADKNSHLIMIKTTMPGDHRKRAKPCEHFTPQDIQNIVEEIAELSQSLHDLLYGTPIVLTKLPQE